MSNVSARGIVKSYNQQSSIGIVELEIGGKVSFRGSDVHKGVVLKEGDTVEIGYDVNDGILTCTSVRRRPAKNTSTSAVQTPATVVAAASAPVPQVPVAATPKPQDRPAQLRSKYRGVKVIFVSSREIYGQVRLSDGTQVHFPMSAVKGPAVKLGDEVNVVVVLQGDNGRTCESVAKRSAPPASKQSVKQVKPQPKPVPTPAEVKAQAPKPAKAKHVAPQKPTLGPIEHIVGPKIGMVTSFDEGKPFGFVSVAGEHRTIFVRKAILNGLVLKKGDLVDLMYGEQLYNGTKKLTATAVALAAEEVQQDLFVFAQVFGEIIAKAA